MSNLKQIGTEIFDQWTDLWNKNLALSEKILAPQLSLHYTQANTEAFDKIETPAQLAEMVNFWHQKRSGIVFKAEGEPVIDLIENEEGVSGLVARPYHVSFLDETGGRVARSGTDILKIAKGKIQEVWSVSSGVQGRTYYPEQ